MNTDTLIARIELSFLDLTDRKSTVRKECYLLLDDRAISYRCVGTYEELSEESSIWEPRRSNYRWTKKRENISNVEIWYANKEDKYCVAIYFHGVPGSDGWYFEDSKEALRVYTQLVEYMIG